MTDHRGEVTGVWSRRGRKRRAGLTVLSHGDAAVSTERRALLNSLSHLDSYWRLDGTAVGSLAGKDLAQDFAEVFRHIFRR